MKDEDKNLVVVRVTETTAIADDGTIYPLTVVNLQEEEQI